MKDYQNFFIKQIVVALLTCLSIWTCQTADNKTPKTIDLVFNQEITSEEGEIILVGQINRAAWQKDDYREWFSSEYDSYKVDESLLSEIQPLADSLEILIFFGTWCSDSRQEVPRFYKIIDFLELEEKRFKAIALDNHPDRDKQSPQHEEVGWNIELVPTFIFLQEGEEIGRIIESPEASLEQDMLGILAKTKG